MKRQILRLVAAAAIASAGVLAFGAPAQAAKQISGWNFGAFSGNQFSFVHQQPITVCGNAIAIFGFASASCDGRSYAINW